MKMSDIQFINPKLVEVKFVVNENYDKKSNDLNIVINNKNKKDEENKKAFVYVDVSIGAQDNTAPYFLKVGYTTTFTWTEDIIDVDKILKINGTSLLYGYIRQMVSIIIGNSKFPKIDLPFIDFSEK